MEREIQLEGQEIRTGVEREGVREVAVPVHLLGNARVFASELELAIVEQALADAEGAAALAPMPKDVATRLGPVKTE